MINDGVAGHGVSYDVSDPDNNVQRRHRYSFQHHSMINDRVGIHGWSYGGYLSLMGLVQYPAEFKVFFNVNTTYIH